ncbi:hypothetical protein EDB80DRAFT_591843 [Ilyonectria destructans]|nr:hypothetical protein EDB80DRAFT_591843 [Ilyonectria destructans]
MRRSVLGTAQVATNAEDWRGSTPLFAAVRNGHVEAVEALLAISDAWIHSTDGFGRSLMWWARRGGHTRIIQLLLNRAEAGIHIIDGDIPLPSEPLDFDPKSPWCDACTLRIPDGLRYYSCETCHGGRFVICLECFQKDVKCLDDSHVLVKRGG